MKKIPTLFERDWDNNPGLVTRQVHAGCEWVAAGEGKPMQKLDGTCCLVRGGRLYRRRELRMTDAVPDGFEEADYDAETGKRIGWVPVGDGKEDQYHRAAFYGHEPDGTYELIGPKVQGNHECYEAHWLIAHDDISLNLTTPPRDFDGLRDWLAGKDIEGIVWHHPDGRMAKIKARDFGLKREKVEAAS